MEKEFYIEKEALRHTEDILKKLRVNYNVEESQFNLFIGSMEATIYFELSDNLDESELCSQMWIGSGMNDKSYHQYYNEKTLDNIESNIEELINAARSYIKVRAKVEALLDKIREEIDNANLGIEFDCTIEDIFGE